MANVRDSDTSLWLHNKLGTSNDSWTGGSICSQLNAEVLRNIKDCFPDLQTQVKLKLLLSFFHVPRRNVDEWRNELEDILEIATLDSELWVAMLAETMKTFPSTGSLNTEISEYDETRPIFAELVNELKKLVNRQTDVMGILPLECHYLNKPALISVVGQQPVPVKHFTLKRKPKSATLRAELLQKSADAASSVKKVSAPTVPVRSRGMPRKMTDTTPLKGIPSRVPTGGFRSPPTNSPSSSRPPIVRNVGRKDGGIKLLDITEQPLGYAAAKKRKRMQELEEQKKASELAAAAQAATSVTDNTPDYAAGLTSTVVFTQPATTPGIVVKEPTTPSSSSSNTTSTTGTSSTGSTTSTSTDSSTPSSYNPNATPNRIPFTHVESPLATHANNPPAAIQQQTIILTPNSIRPPNLSEDSASPSPVNDMRHKVIVASPLTKGKTQTVILANSGVLQKNVLLGVQKGQMVSSLHTGLNTATGVSGISSLQTSPPGLTPTNMQRVTHVKLQTQQAQPAQRKGLSLTKPQMLEAQEMFSKANKVTRPEKALILGFMAGSRDNPCPDLGNIVTIKLSEILENVLQEDDTYKAMLVETHFQMNYENGEWERIKKYRRIDTKDAKVMQHGQGKSIAL